MCIAGVWQEKAFENNLPQLKTDLVQALIPAWPQPQPQPHAATVHNGQDEGAEWLRWTVGLLESECLGLTWLYHVLVV